MLKVFHRIDIHEILLIILGILPRKLSWSFHTGTLPNNIQVTSDGYLIITSFEKSNLGIYTCTAQTAKKTLSQSVNFLPDDVFNHAEMILSYQIYSSRSDYHLGGRLLVQCLSSGRISSLHYHESSHRNCRSYFVDNVDKTRWKIVQ